MSLYLNFEPHSWYMGFAIKHSSKYTRHDPNGPDWEAYTDDGMTYQIIELNGHTLADLKSQIRDYHRRDNGRHMPASLVRFL